MMKPDILIRTDKNGTKYWGNDTCPRCGGLGGLKQWEYTGYTCYECGGSGISKMRIVRKEYTPEHAAKLEAARAKREEKKRLARLEELKNHMGEIYAKHGFGEDGKAYAVTGNTYSIREELKAAGARWMSEFGTWVFATKPEAYETVEIAFEEAYTINEFHGTVYWNSEVDGRELVKSKMPKAEKANEYLGEEGEKIEVEATFINGYEYEATFGWNTTTNVIAKFETEEGNTLIWKTSTVYKRTDGAFAFPDKTAEHGWRRVERGTKMRLTGKVKGHSEYEGTKQTILTRAKATIA